MKYTSVRIYQMTIAVLVLALIAFGATYWSSQTTSSQSATNNSTPENSVPSTMSDQKGRGMIKNDTGKGMGAMTAGTEIIKEGELSDSEKEALQMALADELKARQFYADVISKFGSVRPFNMIIKSEQTHIAELERVYNTYNLAIPEITPETVPVPETLQGACEIGVQAEIDNAALYDKLDAMVTKQGIREVFTNLAYASTNMHQPAFERCSGK